MKIGSLLITLIFVSSLASAETIRGGSFAHAGDWVTTEDGKQVCQLTYDLNPFRWGPRSGWCINWQPGFEPSNEFSPLWMRRTTQGNVQININGNWVP